MSLKTCIDNECKSCSVTSGNGGWREQVENCCGKTCELYNCRPLTTSSKHAEKPKRRAAVDAHCKSCCYDQGHSKGEGSWRKQVENCKVTSCHIWPVRPTTLSNNSIEIKEV